MNLRSLVVWSDEKTLRALRRVLSDLEIAVESCQDADEAIRKLTRERYEAVIVDCADEANAVQVLSSCRVSPVNKQAVTVAMVDGDKNPRSVASLGAHFTLYKPISERAKGSFRAVRALMKCERRRHARVAIEFPVTILQDAKESSAITLDMGEGGMAIQIARRPEKAGLVRLKFILPGSDMAVECAAEMAWQGPASQVGLRFLDLSPDLRGRFGKWVARQSGDLDQDDPPVRAMITDLSLGACYLKIPTPFPVGTQLTLACGGDKPIQAEGVVRITHPETGMGVEFSRTTPVLEEKVEKLINLLVGSSTLPELQVSPCGLEESDSQQAAASRTEDPLLGLFRNGAQLSAENFRAALLQQRNAPAALQEAGVTA